MGVTINWRLKQNKVYIGSMLDRAENVAKGFRKTTDALGIEYHIKRLDKYTLKVDVGRCETLMIDFKSVKEIKEYHETYGWMYEHDVLTGGGEKELDEGYRVKDYPQNEMYYAAGFCKTQFAENVVQHQIVAEILRTVAKFCRESEVNDEGDYYHSGNIGDATRAIGENGKIITQISNTLSNQGCEVQKGGETKISKNL